MDNRPIKAKNNESGTITALLTVAEVTSAHVSPVPENAPGIFVMNPGTTEEEHIFYRERDAVLGTVSGLTRDIENQNGGVGREAQNNAPWETMQSTRYLNNIIDILIEGYIEETNDVLYVSAASFTVKTNRAAFYTAGRIVRFSDGAIGVVSANATYNAGTGLTTVLVTGTVPSDLSTVEMGIQSKGKTGMAFLSDIPSEATGAEINSGLLQNKFASPKAIADSNIAFLSDIPVAAAFWTTFAGAYASASTIVITGSDKTGIFHRGLVIKGLSSADALKLWMVVSSSYGSGNTTITVVGSVVEAGDKSFYYSTDILEEKFIIAGTLAALTDASKTWWNSTPQYEICADFYAKVAGSGTGATAIDINIAGSTKFTTKPTITSTGVSDLDNVADNPTTEVAAGSAHTIDVDSITATTAQTDGYIYLKYIPSWWINRT